MMKKILSLICVVCLIVALASPVSAAEDDSAFLELLEYATVNNSGNNTFYYTTSASIFIDVPLYMRCSSLDMLISFTGGSLPSSVTLPFGGQEYPLTIKKIDDYTARIYGKIPHAYYSEIHLNFTRTQTSTSYVEILSCRVSQLVDTSVSANADIEFSGYYEDGTFGISEVIREIGTDNHVQRDYQTKISVYDWTKYDTISIWGSVKNASIASVRATIGTVGIPFDMSYLDTDADGTWTHAVTTVYTSTSKENTDAVTTSWYGNYLYCITIDLTEFDRTDTSAPLLLYMTGSFDEYVGMEYYCQYVTGGIYVADTHDVAWWNRIKAFFTNLFKGDPSVSDDFQNEATEQGSQMDDLNDELQNATNPPIDSIDTDISDYVGADDMAVVTGEFSQITNDPMILQITMLSLTVALVAYILYGKR